MARRGHEEHFRNLEGPVAWRREDLHKGVPVAETHGTELGVVGRQSLVIMLSFLIKNLLLFEVVCFPSL